MSNMTLDSTSFSEQLGAYDFFNVLVYGSIFVCGVSLINENVKNYLWCDLTVVKGLGLILLVYVFGIILQVLASFYDDKRSKFYKKMFSSILKGDLDEKYNVETSNIIVKNPVLLKHYRKLADAVLKEYMVDDNIDYYENDYINGFMFSVCQYYVAVCGKDKKIEKMRALFSMSKTLMFCFFILAIISIVSLFFNFNLTIDISKLICVSFCGNECYINKIILSIVFALLGILFRFRAKEIMKKFLLILLGTYDAILRSEEKKDL